MSTPFDSTNIFSMAISAALPLFIVFYFMYQDSYSYTNMGIGIGIIFLVGMVAFLCGKCDTKGMGASALKTIGFILVYSLLATLTSTNIKKSSKLKYFWVNLLVQYSLYLNVFVGMMAVAKGAAGATSGSS